MEIDGEPDVKEYGDTRGYMSPDKNVNAVREKVDGETAANKYNKAKEKKYEEEEGGGYD